MPASYPGTAKVFATHVDITETILAANVNDVQNEVVALETTLGVNPHVSTGPASTATFVTTAATWLDGSSRPSLSARLANIEAGLVADAHSQYVRKSGGDTVNIATSNLVGLTIKGAASQTANLFQINDSTGTPQVWVDSSYRLTAPGGVISTSGGIAVTGDSIITGALAVQKLNVAVPVATGIGEVITLAPSQTGDALQVKNSSGTVIYRVNAAGRALGTSSTFTNATFGGGASDAQGDLGTPVCSYMVDSSGWVHLQGTVKVTSGTAVQSILTNLPPCADSLGRRFKADVWRDAAGSNYPAGATPLTMASSWVSGPSAWSPAYYIMDFNTQRVFLDGAIGGGGAGAITIGTNVVTGLPTVGSIPTFRNVVAGGNNRNLQISGTGMYLASPTPGSNVEVLFLAGMNYSSSSQNYYLNMITSSGIGHLDWYQVTEGNYLPIYIPLDGISYYSG